MIVAWDNLGGVCGVVNNAALHLQANGHTVHYLFPDNVGALASNKTRLGFPAHHLYLRPTSAKERPVRSRIAFALSFPFTVLALRRLVRRLRIDIVNIHFPGTWAIHFAALRLMGVGRLVTSIHGSDVLLNGSRDELPHTAINTLFSTSDVLVTPSNGFQAAVRTVWPKSRRSVMETIPNGIDPAELGYEASAGDTAVQPPYVMSILQMISYKGPDILIRAFAENAKQFPDLRMRLIGDGPNRQEYEQLAESLGVTGRIDFLGHRDREFVAQCLRGCLFFVLPSRTNSESFGIAVAEAMAVNRAVIASNIGGLPELVEHNVTGLLVPPGDASSLASAMRQLITSPADRARLGQTAGERVRQSRLWKHTGARYLQLFLRIMKVETMPAVAQTTSRS